MDNTIFDWFWTAILLLVVASPTILALWAIVKKKQGKKWSLVKFVGIYCAFYWLYCAAKAIWGNALIYNITSLVVIPIVVIFFLIKNRKEILHWFAKYSKATNVFFGLGLIFTVIESILNASLLPINTETSYQIITEYVISFANISLLSSFILAAILSLILYLLRWIPKAPKRYFPYFAFSLFVISLLALGNIFI